MPKYLDLRMAERVLRGLSEITQKDYTLDDMVRLWTGDDESR